jgi:glycosyltransferase involved in cell wall biosynthesis
MISVVLLFLITFFTTTFCEQKRFVVVIPSFNNSNWYRENLDSVFAQDYENYHVIYIDDFSTDGTAQLVESYIQECEKEARCTLIKNQKRVGALENLWKAIHSCDATNIIVSLDGDDTLAHKDVLSYLNTVYQNDDIWLTYGQFRLKSNGAKGWCTKIPDHIVQSGSFRTFSHIPSHLRTFYAGLFHNIKLEDLITHRGFYSMTWDIAMMMPMIEMAGERHVFIDDVLYIYNDTTPLNDDKINKQLQSYLARILRAKKPYKRLQQFPKKKEDTVSLIIISQENPLQLLCCLESIFYHCHDFENIQVLYRSYDAITQQGYQHIMKNYDMVTFYQINTMKQNDLKYQLSDILNKITSSYVFLSTDNMIVHRNIDVKKSMRAMQKAHAYAFHFRLGKNIQKQFPFFMPLILPNLIEIDENVFAWNFKDADADWAYASNLDCVLYSTDELRETISRLYFHDVNNFEIQWANTTDIDYIGVCFAESCAQKMVWLHNNDQKSYYYPHELTKLMADGYKIAIELFWSCQEIQTTRAEYIPTFITIH